MRCFVRAENQGLNVGSVQIVVLEVLSNSVRLGINDPKASPSYREEILYLPSDGDADADYDSTQLHEDDVFALSVR